MAGQHLREPVAEEAAHRPGQRRRLRGGRFGRVAGVGLGETEVEHLDDAVGRDQIKGTILEVKDTKGLGKTLDVIIYDGSLSRNDNIVIGGVENPVITRVKALLEPAPLSEMRDKKSRFKTR